MKNLKWFLWLVVFLGCFVAAFFVTIFFWQSKGVQAETRPQAETPGAVQADDTSSSETNALSSIVQDYNRPSTKSGADATTSGSFGSAAARPVRTPDATQKLIRMWGTGHKWVALTFDDGPNPEYTPQLLQLLKEKNARATFFLLGPAVKTHPDLVQEIVKSGSEVGNHTWKHKVLNGLSPEGIRQEITQTSAQIKEAAGVDVKLLRPPYGSANKKVQDACDELGMKIIDWSIDTNDWRSGTTEQTMTAEIMKGLKDGVIILMHDRSQKSLDTTRVVIDQIRAQGYEFVTVSQMLGLADASQVPAPAPKPASTAKPASASVAAAGPNTAALPTPASVSLAASASELPAEPAIKATSASNSKPSAAQTATATGTLPAPAMTIKHANGVSVLPEVSSEKISAPPATARKRTR